MIFYDFYDFYDFYRHIYNGLKMRETTSSVMGACGLKQILGGGLDLGI